MTLEKDFSRAVNGVLLGKMKVSLQTKLVLYGLFTQAKSGDCNKPPPTGFDVLKQQKYLAWKSKKGMSKEQAMREYIEVASQLKVKAAEQEKSVRDKFKSVALNNVVPELPRMPSMNLKRRGSKGNKQNKAASEKDSTDDNSEDGGPRLPALPKVREMAMHANMRKNLFRSRHFSSINGLQNPLAGEEDLAQRYELYEKIRRFYMKVDPSKLKDGIGGVVEWTLEHGEAKLNAELRKKYKKDLNDLQKEDDAKLVKMKEETIRKRATSVALSKRLMNNKDPETKKKMDKLTRFLLVNDPELLSRGMYLLVKFIENKGVGAMNHHLRKMYGKDIDEVTDEELSRELKKKYGNDLDMLDKPLLGDNGLSDDVRSAIMSGDYSSLSAQMASMNKESLKEKTQSAISGSSPGSEAPLRNEVKRGTVKQKSKKRETAQRLKSVKNKKSKRSKRDKKAKMGRGFDMNTMDLSDPEKNKKFQSTLVGYLKKFEPNRFDSAIALMQNFVKKNGVRALNKKLRAKYGLGLEDYESVPRVGNMSEDEVDFLLLQYITNIESPQRIDKAMKSMVKYYKKNGIEALNVKLYTKYGKTLLDLREEENEGILTPKPKRRTVEDVSMAELHTFEVSPEFFEELQKFYAKYDPTILGEQGMTEMSSWIQVNGEDALDRKLKKKYGFSLTEFRQFGESLKKELKGFYDVVDKSNTNKRFQQVLDWAMINGRDALNFNLRKKYGKDLDNYKTPASPRPGRPAVQV